MKTVHQSLRIMGIQKIKKYIVALLHIHSITVIDHIFKVMFCHCLINKKSWMPLIRG